jgi:hypothetical protein
MNIGGTLADVPEGPATVALARQGQTTTRQTQGAIVGGDPLSGVDPARGPQVITGHAAPGGPDWLYVPVEVPPGVSRLTVRCAYDRSAGVLDLGLFDPGGHRLGDRDGFRGWSGSSRSEVTVSATDATPGYLAGPIRAGTWQVVLGPYLLPPTGLDWRVEVEAGGDPGRGVRRPVGTPHGPDRDLVLRDVPGWYRGDLHLHTVHSDGRYTPEEVLTRARAAGLDFIASTDHNTSAAHAAWAPPHQPDLLVLAGEEVTTRAGHWGAVGLPPGWWVDWRYRPEDGVLPAIAREVRAQGALVTANHPFAPIPGGTWEFGYDEVDAVEVWNGGLDELANDEAVAAWDGLLRAGRTVVAVAGSDAHRPPDQVGSAQTVVWADRLAAADLVAGLRAGRCYLAGSARVGVSLSATAAGRRAGMGGRLHGRPDEPLSVRLRVRGAAGSVATLYGQDGPVHEAPVGMGRAVEVTWTAPLGSLSYLRAEVHRPGGDLLALTNPIWFGPDP